MPLVDIADETYVVAAPSTVAAVVRDPRRWRQWWPSLDLEVYRDRRLKGVRWTVSGELAGTAELWLEPFGDGVIVHFFLRADPTRPCSARRVDRLRRALTLRWKADVHALKDQLEAGRRPGTPRNGSRTGSRNGSREERSRA